MQTPKFFNRLEQNFNAMKVITLFSIGLSFLTCAFFYTVYIIQIKEKDKVIYVLDNKAAIKARALSINENREVEVRDQLGRFIDLFFTLDPDLRVIKQNVNQALNISDESVKSLNYARNEKGYYSQLINNSISSRVFTDSIVVDMSRQPYQATYFGRQELIRLTTTSVRKLVVSCYMRDVQRSNENSHGLLVENIKILDNSEIKLNKN